MVKFYTRAIFGGNTSIATQEVTTKEHLEEIFRVITMYKQAALNDVELLKDGFPIMAVRNHPTELLAYLNGEADEFEHRTD